jgi:hypothetical protein
MARAMVMAMVLLVAPAARAEDAVGAAKDWLSALRQKDYGKLKAASGFPFTEAGIGPGNGKCGKKAKAATAAEFDSAANCMLLDAGFVESVPPEPDAKVVQLKSLDNATFKKNMKSLQPLAKDHQFVQTTVTGDGITYQVLLAVRKAAVTLVLAEPKSE